LKATVECKGLFDTRLAEVNDAEALAFSKKSALREMK
jgi:hypothetical protein